MLDVVVVYISSEITTSVVDDSGCSVIVVTGEFGRFLLFEEKYFDKLCCLLIENMLNEAVHVTFPM